MEIVHTYGTGLYVHKKTVVAAILKETRTFETMTSDLLALSDWLTSEGITHVAMESTGEYWKPVFNVLENSFEVLLVNAQHIKSVPGRKTDIKDAEWIADLLRHGLLKASFIPPVGQRELRELTRYRSSFVRERATLVNRVQKALESANIKLASVATDIMGVSGRTRKGNQALLTVLNQAAHAAAKTKNTYLSAQYHRLAGRRGAKKAIVAVEHSFLVIAYHLIKRKQPYKELGGNYFDQRNVEATAKRLTKRLENLGFQVSIQPPSVVAPAPAGA